MIASGWRRRRRVELAPLVFMFRQLVAVGWSCTEGLGAGDPPTLAVVRNGMELNRNVGFEVGGPLWREGADRDWQPLLVRCNRCGESGSRLRHKVVEDGGCVGAPELVGVLAINESRVLRSTKVAVAGWGSSCVGDVSGLGVWWGLWWRW